MQKNKWIHLQWKTYQKSKKIRSTKSDSIWRSTCSSLSIKFLKCQQNWFLKKTNIWQQKQYSHHNLLLLSSYNYYNWLQIQYLHHCSTSHNKHLWLFWINTIFVSISLWFFIQRRFTNNEIKPIKYFKIQKSKSRNISIVNVSIYCRV